MLSHTTLWLSIALCVFRAGAQSPANCLTGTINTYTPVYGFGCDSSSLQVGATTGFSAGDKVLLIQMQVPQVDLSNSASFGALLNSTCIGNYEFNRILSASGNSIQLKFDLIRPYDVSGKVQLVRVPEYDSATVCGITCLPWNGVIGGVLALDVKTKLTLNGSIDVNGKGFRGGMVEPNFIDWFFGEQEYFYPPVSTLSAEKGEGIVQIPQDHSFGRGRAGNGGGGGNAHNAGGGGGGNAGAGGDGGLEITNLPSAPTPNTNGIGGAAFFNTNTNKVLLGGGGGAGHANDAKGSSGGTGGGIIFITANTMQTNSFQISANGVDVLGGIDQNDGQGGGGAGGTIMLDIGQINGALVCALKGGRGGSNPYTPAFQLHGPGGGGGGGKLLLAQNSPTVMAQLQGGINGFTSQNLTNGALSGVAGISLNSFAVPTSNSPSHPVSNNLQLLVQSPQCAGFANGQIGVFQSSALAFQINGGPWQADSVFTNLPPGNYQLGLQFSGGCTLDTSALLLAVPPLVDTLVSLIPASCIAGGEIIVAAISGTPPFEFQLNNGAWNALGIFSNLSAGNFTISTRDSSGCTQSSSFTIDAPPPIAATLLAKTDATCITGGSIVVEASSGTPPFSYNSNGTSSQPNGTFMNLPAGNYTIDIEDDAGCSLSQNYSIEPPPLLIDTLLLKANATCIAGGSLVVQALSGTPPYSFNLNGGLWQPNGAFANLPAGNYSIVLQDDAGCTLSQNYSIEPPPPLVDTLLVLVNATCVAGGSLLVQAISGSPPYAFNLNGGAWQSSGAFTNVPVGTNTISLTDNAGCSLFQNYSIDPPPQLLDTLLAQINATCVAGGTLSVQAISGTPPYSFSLNGGSWQSSGAFPNLSAGNHTIDLTDGAGCNLSHTYSIAQPLPLIDTLITLTNATCVTGGNLVVQAISGNPPYSFSLNGAAGQPGGSFTNLPPGSYTIALTDDAGCSQSHTYSITTPPPLIDTLITLTNASCVTGGSLVVQAISGTPPYSFSLNGAAWQANGVFANLPIGSHVIALTDAAGCTQDNTYNIAPPPPLVDTLLVQTNATCVTGGSLVVQVVSGTAPFIFQLNSGTGQSNGTFANLAAGQYQISITDAAGCTQMRSYAILPPPPARDSLLAQTEIGCGALGSLTFQAIAGTGPYQFRLNSSAWQSNGLFQNLGSGTYTVVMQDAAGCTYSSVHTIVPYFPLQLILDSLGGVDCRHAMGFLSVSANGGKEGYFFELSHNGQIQTNGLFTALAAGFYSLIVTDAAGCTSILEGVEIPNQIDSVTTFQTVSIYEGSWYELPDGQKTGKPGQYPFMYQTTDGCDSLHIIDLIVQKRHVYVPNIFSPNDDGQNDFFSVFSDASLENVELLQVYDRWGELVFEKQNFTPNVEKNGWDGNYRGRSVNPGMFVWVLNATFVDGLKLQLKGEVTLIR